MKKEYGIKLKSYDDIFNVIEKLPENDIKQIDINMLDDFRDHPFKITQNKEMNELYDSIVENGILVPVLVRPVGDRFEIISGHRRKYCALKAGIKTIPCLIKDMDYDQAVFAMIDSNIQRKNILPSEKALSYKMKLNAIKRQGERTDLTGGSTSSADLIGKDYNDSGRSVQRYIRLTELTPQLLDAVDKKKLSFGAGVELSYLNKDEQDLLNEAAVELGKYPSLSQAKEIRELTGNLSETNIRLALIGNAKTVDGEIPGTEQVTIDGECMPAEQGEFVTIELDKIKGFFPEHYTKGDIELAIVEMVRKNNSSS